MIYSCSSIRPTCTCVDSQLLTISHALLFYLLKLLLKWSDFYRKSLLFIFSLVQILLFSSKQLTDLFLFDVQSSDTGRVAFRDKALLVFNKSLFQRYLSIRKTMLLFKQTGLKAPFVSSIEVASGINWADSVTVAFRRLRAL